MIPVWEYEKLEIMFGGINLSHGWGIDADFLQEDKYGIKLTLQLVSNQSKILNHVIGKTQRLQIRCLGTDITDGDYRLSHREWKVGIYAPTVTYHFVKNQEES